MPEVNPFASALDAIFHAPGSAAADYHRPDGTVIEGVRVIRSRPDQPVGFGGGQILVATNILSVRMSEVEEPARGDWFMLGTERFDVAGDAMSDVEGLTWEVGCEPHP